MHVYVYYVFLQNYYGVLRVYLSTESLPSESPSPSHTPSNDDSNDDSNNDGETVLLLGSMIYFSFVKYRDGYLDYTKLYHPRHKVNV